jgi:hypothetical protein
MQPLKAHVKDGRLVLDDPSTDLPEGEVIYLQRVERIVPAPHDDGMGDEERAAVDKELEASIAEADAGETVNFSKMLSELRQQR